MHSAPTNQRYCCTHLMHSCWPHVLAPNKHAHQPCCGMTTPTHPKKDTHTCAVKTHTHTPTLCQHTHWLSPAKTCAENRQDTYVHSFGHNLVQCLQDALQTQARTLLVPSSPADTVRLCLNHNQTSKLTRQRSWWCWCPCVWQRHTTPHDEIHTVMPCSHAAHVPCLIQLLLAACQSFRQL